MLNYLVLMIAKTIITNKDIDVVELRFEEYSCLESIQIVA